MRLAAAGVIAAALTAMLAGCAPSDINPQVTSVDPEIAAERATSGAILGATAGAALGATAAIDPALGALLGAEGGAALGAAVGVMTTPPPPTYTPVEVPANAAGPHFYDAWPPGYNAQPGNPETQSPHAG